MTDKKYMRLYKRMYGKINSYQAERMAEILLCAVVITGLFASVI
jgi:hypothetical protein